MKEFYEKYWNGKLPPMLLFGDPPRWEEKWLKRYNDLVSSWIHPGDFVLDYGCGEGHFLDSLKIENKYGIDISEAAISRARKLYPEIPFTTLDKPFVPKFDVVTSFDVMEHIFDFDEVFKEINAYLKVGGHLLIATNEMCFVKMVAVGVLYMDTFFHWASPHIRFFTRKTLKEMLEYYGYRVVHVERIANHFGLISTGTFCVAERVK